MKIQVGEVVMDVLLHRKVRSAPVKYTDEIVPNKSRKYLLPCLKEYGTEFVEKLNGVYKVAIGIGDIIVSKRGFKHEKHLFLLLDSYIAHSYFTEFLCYIKQHESYQDDYVYGNITKSTYHMIVLKIPERFYDTFETFKLGEYSKMYSKTDIETFFSNHPRYKKILVKDAKYKIKFAEELNNFYQTTIKPEDIKGELDFPPQESEEIFNTHLK